MLIATVLVSYNRAGMLARTLSSYLETVTGEHVLLVVDNGSAEPVRRWLAGTNVDIVWLGENRYPGAAANYGWSLLTAAMPEAALLHRSDNDVRYRPGWAAHVRERFAADPNLGQLGLRTLEEEGPHAAVGGNCVLRRELWDAGVRYGGRPWAEVPFEDSHLSQAVLNAGYGWARATSPCIEHLGLAHPDDPYYQETFRVRGLGAPPDQRAGA